MTKAISALAICVIQFLGQSANAQCHSGHHLNRVPHGYHQVVSNTHCGYNLPPARFATLSRSSASWSQVSSLPVGIPVAPMWSFVRGELVPYGQPVFNGEALIMDEPVPLPDIAEMPPQVPYDAPLAKMPAQLPYESSIAEMPPAVPYSQNPAEMPPNPFQAQASFRNRASSGF